MDLWTDRRRERRAAAAPLAARLRPRTLEEFVGQAHLIAPGRPLRRQIDADRLTSALFSGPPGTGKTSLAEVIAQHSGAHFERAHAAEVGVKDIRILLESARRRREDDARGTILFLDEIHRFARNQQDVLLRDVEAGLITLIGATTENPYFVVNSALISRSTVFRFETLDEATLIELLRRALVDPRGFGGRSVTVTDDALRHWAVRSDGDARRALNALEVAVLSESDGSDAPVHIDLAVAEASIQAKAIVYDRTGDEHYDLASAFIKSMRGSDPDAATYWLACMLEAGEDPRFIARRIAILASEDIGNADPQALTVAASAFAVTERIGLPECRLTLAHAAIYMACAPKSNAVTKAISAAAQDVREGRTQPVPKSLRDSHYAGARALGHTGYVSPHDHEGPDEQTYLGVESTYYVPTKSGFEADLRHRLQASGRLPRPPSESGGD